MPNIAPISEPNYLTSCDPACATQRKKCDPLSSASLVFWIDFWLVSSAQTRSWKTFLQPKANPILVRNIKSRPLLYCNLDLHILVPAVLVTKQQKLAHRMGRCRSAVERLQETHCMNHAPFLRAFPVLLLGVQYREIQKAVKTIQAEFKLQQNAKLQ